jgi:hypothetical protein
MTPPASGISFFISLIILGIGALVKTLRVVFGFPPQSGRQHLQPTTRYRLGILIVGISFFLCILISISFFTIATASQHNNLTLLTNTFTQCTPM